MRIALSGTPGTGKTSVSKELSKILDYDYVDFNKLAEEEKLVSGFDSERNSKEIDTEKLNKIEIPDNSIVDGHLSYFIPVDVVFVLRTNPEELKKRLKNKGWKPAKIQENVEAEILGICSYEASGEREKVVEIDTTGKKPEEIAKVIKKMIEKKDFKTKDIDWLEDHDQMIEKI